jgi:hypothetical protein
LSALFTFFAVKNIAKSALSAQKHTFFTQGGTDFCFTLLLLFHRNSDIKLYNWYRFTAGHRFGFITRRLKC